MRLLVTRPEPEATRTASKLTALGHEVLVAPLLTIEAIGDADLPAEGVGAVAFTSARAVEAVSRRREWRRLKELPVFAVGEKTAQAARGAGARQVMAGTGGLEDLVPVIRSTVIGGPVLYLAGRERSGDLALELEKRGISCQVVEVYRARPLETLPEDIAARLQSGTIDAALVYSRRTAEVLATVLDKVTGAPRPEVLAISRQAAEPLRGRADIRVAAEPSEAAIFALLSPPC